MPISIGQIWRWLAGHLTELPALLQKASEVWDAADSDERLDALAALVLMLKPLVRDFPRQELFGDVDLDAELAAAGSEGTFGAINPERIKKLLQLLLTILPLVMKDEA